MNNEVSATTKARIAGGLWLAVIVTGAFGTLTARKLYVPDDAATTAVRLLASESRFRLAFASNIISFGCYVGVTAIMYHLLKPVSRTLAFFSALSGVTGTAIGMTAIIAQLVPLLLLKGSYVESFAPAQLQSLSLTSFAVNVQGNLVSWVFFGLQCATLGYLIVRSEFLPRVLGVLLAIGGSSYVAGCLAILVVPELNETVFPVLLAAAFLGEGSLSLWLVARGVNQAKWEERARMTQ